MRVAPWAGLLVSRTPPLHAAEAMARHGSLALTARVSLSADKGEDRERSGRCVLQYLKLILGASTRLEGVRLRAVDTRCKTKAPCNPPGIKTGTVRGQCSPFLFASTMI